MAACRVVVHRTRKPLNELPICADPTHTSVAGQPNALMPIPVGKKPPRSRVSRKKAPVVGAMP
jgi:hypothetical protein